MLDYPVEVTAGRPCVVKFSLANQSDVAADIVRIRFDFDTAGDPYFQGFAIEGTTPSGENPAGYGDFMAADYGGLPPHATKEVTISLEAVRPGGYGATARVGLIDQGQLLALYSHPIHTVIR